MTTTNDITKILIQAAEKITDEELAPEDKNRLIKIFNQGSGASYDRALRSLSQFADMDQNQIINKAAESEELDSALMDLQFQMENWRPGS